MRKNEFENKFKRIINNENNKYVVFFIRNKCQKPETIINPRVNFENKFNYCMDVYDDNMCLKNCKEIEMIDIIGIDSLTLYIDSKFNDIKIEYK